MRKFTKWGTASSLGVAALVLFGASDPAMAQKQTFTGQSGMLTISLPESSFVVIDDFTYQYDGVCAGSFFVCNSVAKEWLGSETFANSTCSGDPTTSIPTPSTGALRRAITENRCNFFSGSPLTVSSSTGTCVGISKSLPNSTKESSMRTDIECTLMDPPPVDPRIGFVNPGDVPTCWTLESTTGELPTIMPTGTAASESALCSRQHPLKYSFALQDPLSTNGTRVTGLTVTLEDKDQIQVGPSWSEANLNLSVGLDTIGGDFLYNGANGANGTFSLLTSSGAGYNPGCTSEPALVNDIQAGLVPACGPVPTGCAATDQFAGNNGIGGDRAAYTATTPSLGLTPEGSPYTVRAAATLKSSVSGLATLPLSVCAQVTVNAGACFETSTTCP
jgi:hypothetical protein